MARENFPSGINRRRLLRSVAAAATASGLAPALPRVDAEVIPHVALAVSATPDAPAMNVSARMAERVFAIEQRQKIRREAGLPLLSVIKELKQMKTLEREEQFARFAAAHGKTVLDAILNRRREEMGDPSWKPRWMEAVAIGSRVENILSQRFRAARQSRSTFSQDQPDSAISFDDATNDAGTTAA